MCNRISSWSKHCLILKQKISTNDLQNHSTFIPTLNGQNSSSTTEEFEYRNANPFKMSHGLKVDPAIFERLE